MRYGSIPAGGLGARLQPIGFSKELVPIGRKAAIEYLIERLLCAGIDKIFINTAEDKTDLVRYLSAKSAYGDKCVFLVRPRSGLLDAILQPWQFLRDDDELYFGLPDTLWFPKDAYRHLIDHPGSLVLGLFDSGTPHRFDAVETDADGRIKSIQVKVSNPGSKWTWGIGKIKVGEIPKILACACTSASANPALFGTALHNFAQSHAAYGIQFPDSSYLDIGCIEDQQLATAFLKCHDRDASKSGASSA